MVHSTLRKPKTVMKSSRSRSKAGLATVADIEESQEMLSTSSDDEMVITTENDAANIQAMADDAESDLNVEVIHAGNAPTIGVEAQPRESSWRRTPSQT